MRLKFGSHKCMLCIHFLGCWHMTMCLNLHMALVLKMSGHTCIKWFNKNAILSALIAVDSILILGAIPNVVHTLKIIKIIAQVYQTIMHIKTVHIMDSPYMILEFVTSFSSFYICNYVDFPHKYIPLSQAVA